jgi:eukaryotic-like serine/threonine-protein kinase
VGTDRWTRLSEDFETALAMSPQDRAAFLERVGADDQALRGELESLLRASDASAGFLEHPPTGTVDASATREGLPAGVLLGHWRILRLIGRGGMGEVYDAERATGDFEHRVAVKLTRRESAAQLERFNAERQLLARLDHPGIARLLDGGVAPDGRPYFVMEYIDGRPITAYCDAARAGLAPRLALILQVCDAIAYAHRHLIVHRDIKPANVLVDGDGRARLLDFGIAKPLDLGIGADESAGATTSMLTPDYAAPEQLAGEPVTTATDVHGLGVLLFELLTGRRPWSIEGQPLARALHTLLERSAPRPSVMAAATNERPIEPRALQGDVDAIIAKCLRREPNHRYATVEALKLDIERSLRGDTVTARGDATLYVLGRFVRRYRWAVASVAAIITILSVGIAATAWQAQRAEREAARATATRDFLIGIFKASDPRIAQDKPRGQVTARELLDVSIGKIDQEFADDPQTQIELLGVATEIYRELDEGARYEDLHRRHLAAARKHYGEEHPIVLSALLDEATYAKNKFDRPRALRLLDALDPLIRRAGLDRTVIRARWWLARGQALFAESSRWEENVVALRTAADLFAAIAPTHPERVTALADLGTTYQNRLIYEPARTYLEQSIVVSESVENRNDSELATIYGNLGQIEHNLGDFEAADQAYARAEQIIRRTYGESRNLHWIPAANRARAAHLGGNRERALTLFAALLASIPTDSKHHDAFTAREFYAACLAAEGRASEAVPLLEAAERFYQSTAEYDYEVPRVRAYLGDAYDRTGRTDDARRMLTAALEERVATQPPDVQPVLASRERWGRFLLSQGDLAGAEAEFQEVIRQARGRTLSHIALAHGGIARVSLARAEPAQARAASDAALDIYGNVTGFRDMRMGPYLWLVQSEVLLASGDRKGARAFAKRALEALQRYDHPSAPSIAEAEAAVRAAGRD